MSEREGFLWNLISRLPVIGRLREVPRDALKEARDEVLTTTLFAAMPFWFPLIAAVVMTEAPSRKPDEQYDIIEACSWGPFIELFSRGKRDGWDAWGDQADETYRPTWPTYDYNSSFAVAAE